MSMNIIVARFEANVVVDFTRDFSSMVFVL